MKMKMMMMMVVVCLVVACMNGCESDGVWCDDVHDGVCVIVCV